MNAVLRLLNRLQLGFIKDRAFGQHFHDATLMHLRIADRPEQADKTMRVDGAIRCRHRIAQAWLKQDQEKQEQHHRDADA